MTNRAIRKHVVFGDALGIEDAAGRVKWYRPEPMPVFGARAEARFSVHYRAEEHDESLTLDFGVMSLDLIKKLMTLGRSASLAAMERRWQATIGRIGPLASVKAQADGHTALIPLCHPVFSFARRPRHPSHVFDRIAVLDRDLASGQIDTLLLQEQAAA